MVTYDDWKQFFPLKEPRPEQITAINFKWQYLNLILINYGLIFFLKEYTNKIN